jgi:hypothetical protein
MYTGTSQLEMYAMGMATVDENKKVSLHSSDQPYEHIDEAKKMDDLVNNYLSSKEGESLMDYLGSRSKSQINIKEYGSGDLGENVVAAVLHDGIEGVILSNYNGKPFTERITEMAGMYGLTEEATTEYVLAHEFAHAAGYKSEAETESVIKEYFLEMAAGSEGDVKEKYDSLARVAEERCKEAKDYN